MLHDPPLSATPAWAPPGDMDDLLDRVARRHAALSPQLQRIARHVECHRATLALERIQDVAAACAVQPSAVVRFAQCFGLRGFHALKRLSVPVAEAWVRGGGGAPGSPGDRASASAGAGWAAVAPAARRNRIALDRLPATTVWADLETAATWLLAARRVRIAAHGPATAVAHRLGCGWWAGGAAGRVGAAASPGEGWACIDPLPDAPAVTAMAGGDVCVLVHLAPHDDGALSGLAAQARQAGAALIVLTDSRLPRLGQQADLRLLVESGGALQGSAREAGPGTSVLPALWLAEALLTACARRASAMAAAALA